MKEFFKSTGVKVTVVLFAVLTFALLSAVIFTGDMSLPTSLLRTLTSPVVSLLNHVADNLEGIYGYMYDYDRIKNENEEMRAYIAEMEEIVRRSTVSNDENARLRELLNLQEKRPEFVFEAATLTSWSASNWSSAFTINKGSSSGIHLYDCVVTENGYLVGQITELGTTTATVRTIIDAQTSVGALIDRSGVSGVAEGSFSLMRDGLLRLSFLPTGTDLLSGDTILTSGKGEVYPQGIVIGKLVSEQIDDSGLTRYGVIEPSVKLESLTQVFIIKDFVFTEN